jgi:hypothetical protein
MSGEPVAAAMLDQDFVREFMVRIRTREMKWEADRMAIALDQSQMVLHRDGTPPLCDSGDFAHLTWPVLVHVEGDLVTMQRQVRFAVVFNNDTNRIQIECMFGENQSSSNAFSFSVSDPNGIGVANFTGTASNLLLSSSLGVAVDCRHVDYRNRIQDVEHYVELVVNRLETCAWRMVAQIRGNAKQVGTWP